MFSFFRKKPPAEPVAPAAPAAPAAPDAPDAPPAKAQGWRGLFGGAPKAEPPAVEPVPEPQPEAAPPAAAEAAETSAALDVDELAAESPAERRGWFDKLRSGLRKTGSSIAQVFTGTQIDEVLYEDLESALLMADAGVSATEVLLDDLRRRVRDAKAT